MNSKNQATVEHRYLSLRYVEFFDNSKSERGRRDRIVVGFTTTCAISAYHHYSCEFVSRSWRGVLDILCDKGCQ